MVTEICSNPYGCTMLSEFVIILFELFVTVAVEEQAAKSQNLTNCSRVGNCQSCSAISGFINLTVF